MSEITFERSRGKRKTQDPCEACFLHKDRCLCGLIPKINLRTKLSLVIHHREMKRTTNTGLLATKALTNSDVLVRGQIGAPLDFSTILIGGYRPVLFFPSKDAIELDSQFVNQSPQPIQLIVPDGNWRQASKIHYRHQELRDIPRVMVKQPGNDTLFMRAESKSEGMATLQAVAYALGVIEGPDIQSQLLRLYQLKLERTLQGRGQLTLAK